MRRQIKVHLKGGGMGLKQLICLKISLVALILSSYSFVCYKFHGYIDRLTRTVDTLNTYKSLSDKAVQLYNSDNIYNRQFYYDSLRDLNFAQFSVLLLIK